jgi:hypothetical protein
VCDDNADNDCDGLTDGDDGNCIVTGPPELTNIVVTPDPAVVAIGGTQHFIATGYDQYGNIMGINPVWSTNSCGTIDGGGLFTAPTVVGQCTVTATDTAISGTATVSVTYVLNIMDIPVVASSDDAEEAADGGMYLNSSDLELVDETTNQTVGMRFNGVDIPQGASITNAYIQFQVDEVSTGAVSLTMQGEAADDAVTFSSTSGNISGRPSTVAAVDWNPPDWMTVGEAGPYQQTADIAAVIQEIVDRGGWTSGNSLAIIITGTGKRVAA